MQPAQEERLLARLKRADKKIADAKKERLALLREARKEGITFRRIAAALDMTDRGVVRILERAEPTKG